MERCIILGIPAGMQALEVKMLMIGKFRSDTYQGRDTDVGTYVGDTLELHHQVGKAGLLYVPCDG